MRSLPAFIPKFYFTDQPRQLALVVHPEPTKRGRRGWERSGKGGEAASVNTNVGNKNM